MPAQLIAYVAHAFGKASLPVSPPAPRSEDALKKILLLLRAQTVTIFPNTSKAPSPAASSGAWPSTRSSGWTSMSAILQQTPADVEALFRDLLIGVASFFRDPEAFGALQEHAIPRLFADKPTGEVSADD